MRSGLWGEIEMKICVLLQISLTDLPTIVISQLENIEDFYQGQDHGLAVLIHEL
jgi:hypothetical protein